MDETDKILLLGSAPDVERCKAFPRQGIDRIVAMNNAWQVRGDWDSLVHPEDFPLHRRPGQTLPGQTVHDYRSYVPAVNEFGGFVFCGGTMAFTAAYWALHSFRPGLVAILGCDMMYPASGRTHFYGQGTPDPLRADVTLQSLEAKSARLGLLAARQGCAVVNLSNLPASRLALPRLDAARFGRWTDADRRDFLAPLTSPDVAAAVDRIVAEETALDYGVPSGKYWKQAHRFDAAVLRRIDAMWLSLVCDAQAA